MWLAEVDSHIVSKLINKMYHTGYVTALCDAPNVQLCYMPLSLISNQNSLSNLETSRREVVLTVVLLLHSMVTLYFEFACRPEDITFDDQVCGEMSRRSILHW